jgi:beta-phosphoglucomutase
MSDSSSAQRGPGMRAAVIFDMDGVLVDNSDVHEQVWAEWFDEAGHDPGPGGPRGVLGRRGADVLVEVLGERVDEEERAAILARLEDRGDALLRAAPPPLTDGAAELMARLADAGVPLALATSARRSTVDGHLGDLVTRFSAIVTASEVRAGKPDPEIYLAAATRLGVDPGRCTVLEDAVPGVRAAVAAGMRVVGVTGTASAAALREAGADRTVDALTELTEEDLCRPRT